MFTLCYKMILFYIIKSFYQISGVAGGPVVAVYVMGMFTKFANKKVLLLVFYF